MVMASIAKCKKKPEGSTKHLEELQPFHQVVDVASQGLPQKVESGVAQPAPTKKSHEMADIQPLASLRRTPWNGFRTFRNKIKEKPWYLHVFTGFAICFCRRV